jgi:hypothetical protein
MSVGVENLVLAQCAAILDQRTGHPTQVTAFYPHLSVQWRISSGIFIF